MSTQQIDISKILGDNLEREVKSRVEKEVVQRFMDQVEGDIRSIVRQALQEWTIGAIHHMRDVMDLSERLKVELVLTERKPGEPE